jgi:hypothetical protein
MRQLFPIYHCGGSPFFYSISNHNACMIYERTERSSSTTIQKMQFFNFFFFFFPFFISCSLLLLLVPTCALNKKKQKNNCKWNEFLKIETIQFVCEIIYITKSWTSWEAVKEKWPGGVGVGEWGGVGEATREERGNGLVNVSYLRAHNI